MRCLAIGFSFLSAGATVGYASCGGNEPVKPSRVTEIAPGNFVRFGVHELMSRANAGGIANIGFVVGQSSVAVIDTGGSACDGLRLRAAIRSRTTLPIRYVIATHVHPDHLLGHAAFEQDQPAFIGHARLKAALAARGAHYLTANRDVFADDGKYKTKVIVPDVTVGDRYSVDLGGRTLELRAHGAAHTDNDLSIFDPSTRTLWTGDLVFQDHLPVIDGSLVGWLKVMEEMATLPVRTVVPGHGKAGHDWPGFFAPQRGYLTTLAGNLRRLIRQGATMTQAIERTKTEKRGHWKLFDEFHPRNVTAGFAELEWE